MKAAVVLASAILICYVSGNQRGQHRNRQGEDYFLPGLGGAFDLFGNIASKAIAKFAYDACWNPGSGTLEDKAKKSRYCMIFLSSNHSFSIFQTSSAARTRKQARRKDLKVIFDKAQGFIDTTCKGGILVPDVDFIIIPNTFRIEEVNQRRRR